MVLKILPSMRATSIIEPARLGLQTEPYDSDPSMYIAVEVPEILKPCIRALQSVPFFLVSDVIIALSNSESASCIRAEQPFWR